MKLNSTLLAAVILIFSSQVFAAAEVSCQEQAEAAAIAAEKESNKKEKFQVKNTVKEVTDSKTEETYTTEVYNSNGGFVPYNIVVKKAGCKILSVKATTL